MAHFRGTVMGDKSNSTEASRLGHKHITGRLNGWNAGVQVELYIDKDGRDCAEIILNGGSNGGGFVCKIFDGPIDDIGRKAFETKRFLAREAENEVYGDTVTA